MGPSAAQAPGSVPGAPSIDLAVRALPLLSWDGFGIVEASLERSQAGRMHP